MPPCTSSCRYGASSTRSRPGCGRHLPPHHRPLVRGVNDLECLGQAIAGGAVLSGRQGRIGRVEFCEGMLRYEHHLEGDRSAASPSTATSFQVMLLSKHAPSEVTATHA